MSLFLSSIETCKCLTFFILSFIQERPHEFLEKCVAIFEREFENLLMREFAEYDFKHMTGYDF